MKHFDYQVRRPGGEPVTDSLMAIDEATARQELESLGYEVLSIRERATTTTVTATAAQARLPLEVVLEALSDDVNDRRLRTAAKELIAQLKKGATLDEALQQVERTAPRYLVGLLRAATSAGNLAEVCDNFVLLRESSARSWRAVRGVMFYPVILFAALAAVGAIISLWVIPQFYELYREFDLELPGVTGSLLSIGRYLPWVLVGLLVFWLVVVWVPQWVGRGYDLRNSLPMIGGVFVSVGHEQFAKTLARFVRVRIPLPAALTYTGDLVDDRSLGRAAYRAAAAVERGDRLSDVFAGSRQIDRSLTVLVRWGEHRGNLAETLELAADMYGDRQRQRMYLVHRIVPPVTLVIVASTVLVIAAALMLPLVNLIEGLT